MNTLRLLHLAALAAALPFAAHAQHDSAAGKPPVVDLKPPPGSATPQAKGHAGPDGATDRHAGMDSNGDGLISREEFMRHHETMYDRMEKTPDGQVDMKRMHSPGASHR
jgi:hypothetical protein